MVQEGRGRYRSAASVACQDRSHARVFGTPVAAIHQVVLGAAFRFPENPGSDHMVVFVGLAGPVETSLVGPPQRINVSGVGRSGHNNEQDITMKKSLMLTLSLAISAVGAVSTHARDKDSAVQNVWVQVVPPGDGMLRAVTTDKKCPKVRLDRKNERMHVRAEPNEDFDVIVCELPIPRNVESIEVAGRSLKPVTWDPQRIAVVGDTGCRMKKGSAFDDGFQNCDDTNDWEFAKVAEQVAAWEPDLIIQLGDYIYREQPCPDGCNNCKDSPYNASGQRMETWNVEFFTPGRPMLEAAPVVLVRGDHEKCERAGQGYFRFLDAGANRACTDFSDPYALNFKEVQMIVMDTVQADDTSVSSAEIVTRYAADFETVANLAKGTSWLMSHRPIWAFRPAATDEDPEKDACENFVNDPTLELEKINLTTQQALHESSLTGLLPPQIDLVLVSHAHVGEVLSFSGPRTPQFVVGISGTKLLPAVPSEDLIGLEIDGDIVAESLLLSDHGFFGFERREGGDWTSTVISADGEKLARCDIVNRIADCSTN